jgi:hypothetical protein
MRQLGELDDDEIRIKEELFMLLYFFIMTYNTRKESIKNIIKKNQSKLIEVCQEFKEVTNEDDNKTLMNAMINTLENMSEI